MPRTEFRLSWFRVGYLSLAYVLLSSLQPVNAQQELADRVLRDLHYCFESVSYTHLTLPTSG